MIDDGSGAASVIDALAPGASRTFTITVEIGATRGRAALTAAVSTVMRDSRHYNNVTRCVIQVV